MSESQDLQATARKLVRQVSRAASNFKEQAICAEAFAYPLSIEEHEAPAEAELAASTGLEALDTPLKLPEPKRSPEKTILQDKIGFFMGLVNLVLTSFWIGRSPQTWHLFFTVKAIVLFTTRYILYSRKHWHYYMLEFCYFGNIIMLLQIWVFPASATMHKVVFALVSGPITWSIVALRNSLVLHDLDKTTSLFMHVAPALMAWAVKWHWPIAATPEFAHATLWELTVLPMGAYMIWAVAYYLKVFVFSTEKIAKQNYATLYTLMLKNKEGMAARMVLRAPKSLQPLVYMLNHLAMCWAATLTSVLWWHSYWAHTIFVAACAAVSGWNGATFYFEIFLHRYLASVGMQPRPPKPKKAA